jgi:hypothetical protein
MTRGELTELILLAMVGGKLTNDSNVKREEINVFLPAALATASRDAIFEQRAQARADLAAGVLSSFDNDPAFYKPFTATPVKDDTNGFYYIVLPQLMALPHNWETRTAYIQKNPAAPFVKMMGATAFAGAERYLNGISGYWVEYGIAPKMYFTSMPYPICPVIAEIVQSPEGLGQDDTLPYPDAVIEKSIRYAERHFGIQVSRPADNRSDNKDVNEQGA